MDPTELHGVPVDPHGFWWIPVDSIGVHWIPTDASEFQRIPVDCNGSEWDLMDSTVPGGFPGAGAAVLG